MNIKNSVAKLAALRHEPITVYRSSFDALPHDPAVPGFSFYTAVQHDYPAIAAILNDSFPDRAFSADSVWKSIVAPTYAFCTFVAVARGGLVVATASARRRFGLGEVAWVGCRPDYRRRGISTALVQHTCNALRQYGFDSACAVLNPPTAESVAFWAACGFYMRKEDADA